MSTKKYDTPAERQRAHRQRVKDRLAGLTSPPPAQRQPRKKTRPQRLDAIVDALQTMADEYEDWRDAMPRNQTDSDLANELRSAILQLLRAIDVLESIDLPRGFGRR